MKKELLVDNILQFKPKLDRNELLMLSREHLQEILEANSAGPFKNVAHAEVYLNLNIDGTGYDYSGPQLNSIEAEFRYLLNKNFLSRWAKAFDLNLEKDFKDDEFDENGMFNESFNMTLVYALDFNDGSRLNIDFIVDDYASGMPEYDYDGDMARDFADQSKNGEIQWNTDDLDAFIKEQVREK